MVDRQGWIPVSEKKPEAEKEVLILARRKLRKYEKYIITTGIYEDGTVHTEDSEWTWYDHDFEMCEETDDYIVSEGWWEYRHYNQDDVYNNLIDDKVIAWMPLPETYRRGCEG